MIDHGPEAIAALTPARQAAVQNEIGEAFRAAFATIALFTGTGAVSLRSPCRCEGFDPCSDNGREPHDQDPAHAPWSCRGHHARALSRTPAACAYRARARRGASAGAPYRRRLEAGEYLHEPAATLRGYRRGDRARVRARRRRRSADLNDIDYGRWQFKTHADAKADDPALFAAWFATPQLVRFPGGESLQDLAARVADALRLVLARHGNDTIVSSATTASTAHSCGAIGLPLSAYWRFEQSPCCLNEIDVEAARFTSAASTRRSICKTRPSRHCRQIIGRRPPAESRCRRRQDRSADRSFRNAVRWSGRRQHGGHGREATR